MMDRFRWPATDSAMQREAEKYFRELFGEEPVGTTADERYLYVYQYLATADFDGVLDLTLIERQSWLRARK